MRTTKQVSVTLTHELAEQVQARVASGEYASESEVIRDGLRALAARDRALEGWLQNVAGAALDNLNADPSRAQSSETVRETLRREGARLKKHR